MILFDGLTQPKGLLDRPASSAGWNAPLGLTRGDRVLTVFGWETVTEDAWQFYQGPELVLNVLGRGRMRLKLPIFRLDLDGSFLAYTRIRDCNARPVTSLGSVSITFYAPLEVLDIGYRAKDPEGRWVALSGAHLVWNRNGSIRPKATRLLAEGDPNLKRGFKPKTVELPSGTLAVEAQSMLTRSMIETIEEGGLDYGH